MYKRTVAPLLSVTLVALLCRPLAAETSGSGPLDPRHSTATVVLPTGAPLGVNTWSVLRAFGEWLPSATGPVFSLHLGLDMLTAWGTPVQATADGIVESVSAEPGNELGFCIVILHTDSVRTIYGHLSRVEVKVGQPVRLGDRIALSGATGYAEQPALHYGVTIGTQYVDPMLLLPGIGP